MTGALVMVLAVTIGGPASVAAPQKEGTSTTSPQDEQPSDANSTAEDEDLPVPAVGKDDVVAASVAARVSGKPVTVESLTDEFSTTAVNPDGSYTTQMSAGQQRFRGTDGEWVEVDLDLAVRADGSVGPKAHPLGIRLPGDAGAGGKLVDAISVTHPGGGRQVTWRLPVKGRPVLEETTARYVDAWPGVDVVIDARRSGFEQTFVLTDPAAADALPGADKVSWSVPLLTKGLTARTGGEGVVEFVDAQGVVVSTIVAPVAFDAQVDDRSGLPTSTTQVDLDVVPAAGKGRAELVVSVDRAWLTDAARVFPVTVDPTYALVSVSPSMDTYVLKSATYQTYASDDELLVGTHNGGGDIARSFLNFPTSAVVGKQVMSANLSLYEHWSWSCTASPVGAHATTTTVASTVTWPTKPTYTSTPAGSVNAARGASTSCPGGRVNIPLTSLVQSWAAGTSTTRSVMVKAGSESDNNGWKRFYSSEGKYAPVLGVNYNRPPATPAVPVLPAAVQYYNAGDGSTQSWTAAKRPRFESSTTDPDANTVKLEFEVHTTNTNVSDATLKATCTTALGTGGTVLGCTPTVDLVNHSAYYLRAKALDSTGTTGSWSGFKKFYVDWTAGAAPVITCPDPYTDGSWADTPPATDVTCRATGAAPSTWDQNVRLEVQVDGGTLTSHPIPNSSDPAVAGVDVTVPRTGGGHTIRVTGVSRTGVKTGTVLHSFGYGAAGMRAPLGDPRPTVTGVVPVEAAAPPAQAGQSVTATLKYRVAGSEGGSTATNWFDAPDPILVSQKNGQSEAAGTWNTAAAAVNTNTGADERVPVVLEVQVCFTYGGGVTKCTGEQDARSVFRVPHAFGNGFPVTDAGPGQVALFTGEFNTTVTDVSVPGYTGDMSLSRSHATYGLPTTPAQGVFGPGWVANLDGSEVGLAGATLIDNTRLDGSLVLVDGDGEAVVFDPPSSADGTYRARTTATLEVGTWLAGSEDTAASGMTLKVTGTGTSTALAITDIDGNITTFTPTTAPTTATAGIFAPASVVEVGVPGAMTFARDTAGRVTRIVAPAPADVSCPGTGPVTTPGCRVLDITYGTTTSGTEVAGQVRSVSATLFDPAKGTAGAMETVTVAEFAYNSAKRLTSVTDPRTGLATTYAYDTAGRLTGLTPPGVDGFTLQYTGGTGTTPAQLTAVRRDSTQLNRFVYAIDLAAPPAGLPNLDKATVGKWGQAQDEVPTTTAAVF
ncbi:DNRLRE domain-containing protein, partial [Ornithinimicrobium sp. LYQ103]